MDETIMNTVEEQLDGQTTMFNEETGVDAMQNVAEASEKDDALKSAIDEQLKKIQRQNLLVGAQTVCTVILQKINGAMSKPGKRTMNDYKRIIKDIEHFCQVGVSRKVNADGETEVIEETADQNNTKLMEDGE